MTLPRPALTLVCTLAAFGLTACTDGFDLDLRDRLGGTLDTSDAALNATGGRPAPDDRGVISYPNYQVAVARRNDTVADVAARVGLPADELARFNGVAVDDVLRAGEIIALPRRVEEPSPATGAPTTGPIQPPATVDVATLAGDAIDRAADTTPPAPEAGTGVEPVRHQVKRGETAFTIARLYDVSPRALAEWNALDRQFTVREGQFLLVPVTAAQKEEAEDDVSPPGSGSSTPTPPSAATPLPENEDRTPEPATPATADPAPAPASPTAATPDPTPAPAPEAPVADIGQDDTPASNAALQLPLQGSIIRAYSPGRNDGIDIAAAAGTTVRAAGSGQVAAITRDTNGTQIVVIRHPDDLLTVYSFVDSLTVQRGDAVSRGQGIGQVQSGDPSFLHFEVRKGFDSVDPQQYLR